MRGVDPTLAPVTADNWRDVAIFEGDSAVAHVMWGVDDDGSHWIGGLLVDAAHQARSSLGFVETGECDDDELVVERQL